MKKPELLLHKIYTPGALLRQRLSWKAMGKKVSFTNGVFDILHDGHIQSLSTAAQQADYLIVAINSDASTKRLKGPSRPVNNEYTRALLLATMAITDAVVVFDEDTPLNIISLLLPDVLVKGGDYTLEQIVGAKEVIAAGGQVIINPILEGFSTTGIIERMKSGSRL
jgi:D-glycero-beta-D-manno-heptose 1-phosphate adenylyltransferase